MLHSGGDFETGGLWAAEIKNYRIFDLTIVSLREVLASLLLANIMERRITKHRNKLKVEQGKGGTSRNK